MGQNCWITKFLTWPHFLASSSSYTYLVTSAHLKDNFIYYTNNKFLARSFSVHGPTCIIELKKILSYQTMSIVLIFISEYTCIIDKEEPFHFMLLLEYSWIFFFEFCPFWSDFLLKQGPNYKLVYITKIISESYVIDGWFISCIVIMSQVTTHRKFTTSTINAGNDFAKKQNKDLQSIKKSCCWLNDDLLLTYDHDHVVT